MKKILISLFVFLFTLGVTIYDFWKGNIVFGVIVAIFCFLDFAMLAYNIIRRISK